MKKKKYYLVLFLVIFLILSIGFFNDIITSFINGFLAGIKD